MKLDKKKQGQAGCVCMLMGSLNAEDCVFFCFFFTHCLPSLFHLELLSINSRKSKEVTRELPAPLLISFI